MREYGLFNDEDCVERGFWSEDSAQYGLLESYNDEDELYVAGLCPDHEEQELDYCDECYND